MSGLLHGEDRRRRQRDGFAMPGFCDHRGNSQITSIQQIVINCPPIYNCAMICHPRTLHVRRPNIPEAVIIKEASGGDVPSETPQVDDPHVVGFSA